jgi:hypothetical protein
MAFGLPLITILTLFLLSQQSSAFSTPTPNGNDATYTLFDRFRAVCPADEAWVRQFDASLIEDSGDSSGVSATGDSSGEQEQQDQKSVWVAVYRSNNNKPSVLVKDSFLQAMKSATDSVSTSGWKIWEAYSNLCAHAYADEIQKLYTLKRTSYCTCVRLLL